MTSKALLGDPTTVQFWTEDEDNNVVHVQLYDTKDVVISTGHGEAKDRAVVVMNRESLTGMRDFLTHLLNNELKPAVICNRYKHLLGIPLQNFYEIEIQNDGVSKKVFFHSKIHVNRMTELPTSYAVSWPDSVILSDHTTVKAIKDRWGHVYAYTL